MINKFHLRMATTVMHVTRWQLSCVHHRELLFMIDIQKHINSVQNTPIYQSNRRWYWVNPPTYYTYKKTVNKSLFNLPSETCFIFTKTAVFCSVESQSPHFCCSSFMTKKSPTNLQHYSFVSLQRRRTAFTHTRVF